MIASIPEVEWDDNEREWMLALAAYRASLCPVCGNPRAECMDPAAENGFTVPPPARCHRATALKRAQKDRQESPGEHDDALAWSTVRNTTT